MLGLLENLLISLINSTHLSAHNRVYSPNSLITFDILEVVIAVCLPPPQWCSSSTSPVHRWTKAKAILQQRKQQVNLCDIVAVKEVVKSLLWPTREKLKVFSSQAPGLEVISLFCNLFFPSLSLCVRTSGQMGSVVSSSSANWHSVSYCQKTAVSPDSHGSVRTYMWHLPIALMAHMSQLQRAVLRVGNCFGRGPRGLYRCVYLTRV